MNNSIGKKSKKSIMVLFIMYMAIHFDSMERVYINQNYLYDDLDSERITADLSISCNSLYHEAEKSGLCEITVENVTTDETFYDYYTENELEDRGIHEIFDEPELLGNWRITAYCACKKCSGKWGSNSASGNMLKAGISVATPDSLPFDTKIIVESLGEYTVHDRMAQNVLYKYGNTIDIYCDSHDDVVDFGLKYKNVYIVKQKD